MARNALRLLLPQGVRPRVVNNGNGRTNYHGYYSTPEAAAEMRHASQGMHAFLRAYFHVKSAACSANRPHPLERRSAQELAELPAYYVMNLNEGMAETCC
jgi:hypothetical protein